MSLKAICFVIQPFDNGKFDKRFTDCFSPAIEAAQLQAYRVDRDPTTVVPIDTIHEKINESAVCLADITTDNPNVWYELGYAMSSGKNIVLICSDERVADFPFDIRHRTIIKYKTDSSSDYNSLQRSITSKLIAFRNSAQSVSSQRPPLTNTTDLKFEDYELSIFSYILDNRMGPKSVERAYDIRQWLSKMGYKGAAATFGLEQLLNSNLIDFVEEYDEGLDIEGYRISEYGMKWAMKNKSLFVLKASSEKSSADDDFYDPFAGS